MEYIKNFAFLQEKLIQKKFNEQKCSVSFQDIFWKKQKIMSWTELLVEEMGYIKNFAFLQEKLIQKEFNEQKLQRLVVS